MPATFPEIVRKMTAEADEASKKAITMQSAGKKKAALKLLQRAEFLSARIKTLQG